MPKPVFNKFLTKPETPSFYGTAGYRSKSEDMIRILCRASIIAYIRSSTFAGKFIGFYISASHNTSEYNGVKFVDFNGNMLDECWEQNSDELVNCDDADFHITINKIFRRQSNYRSMQDSIYGNVLIGRDTRESGEAVAEAVKEVLKEFRCNVYDFGITSCPEMHFIVRKSNERRQLIDKGEYIHHLKSNFIKLRELTKNNLNTGIDTANGVADIKIREMLEIIPNLGLEILNKPGLGTINSNCGADYIVSKKMMPKVMKSQYRTCISFDGDMDRLIFYNGLRHYDGDAQCIFIANYLKGLAEKCGIRCEVGTVMSYYSNTGAVEHLNKQIKVVLAQTGAKNFVKEARAFDIGVYFEPNGHGSVVFSRNFIESVDRQCPNSPLKPIAEMFDPTVCDALANMLVFKAILKSTDELLPYKEHFSRHLKVVVRDKSYVKVDKAYRVLNAGVQKEIDQAAAIFRGRAFIRPSGTEDVVRIFAECTQELQCDKLALTVAQLVYDRCNGVGIHPEISYAE